MFKMSFLNNIFGRSKIDGYKMGFPPFLSIEFLSERGFLFEVE